MFSPMDIGIVAGVTLLVFGPKYFPPPASGLVIRNPLLPPRVIKHLPKAIQVLLGK
jgi:hypothetical protein